MANTRDLLTILEEFEKSPESFGYDLRLDLADLVIRLLRQKGWTQKQLAKAARMKESFITRIIHSASNCTFDVAGRLMFALGVRAKLAEAPVESLPAFTGQAITFSESMEFNVAGTIYAQNEQKTRTAETATRYLGTEAAHSTAPIAVGE